MDSHDIKRSLTSLFRSNVLLVTEVYLPKKIGDYFSS